MRIDRERRKRRAKRLAIIALAVVAVLLVAAVGGALLWMRAFDARTHEGVTTGVSAKDQLNLAKAKPQEPFTVLLMGADYRRGDTAYRADTIILAKIDPKTRRVWIISIPRDTRVILPGHGANKINNAHFFGGPKMTVETVQKLTGVKINHYMEVNFRGFIQIVDALGGVWVNVPVEIDDWAAASGSPHHRAKHVDAGYQKLDGEHALTFVRARHQFADQDFARMRNQQTFFKALAKQMASGSSLVRLPVVVSRISRFIKTDMSLVEMVQTAQALRGAGEGSVDTVSLKGEWKTPFVWLDEPYMAQMVDRMERSESFDDTKTAPAASVTTPTASKPAGITITVRNGAGISGCAAQAAAILKARDFTVKETGNANQFVYKQTLVIYPDGHEAEAKQVAATFPFAKLVASRGMYSFKTDVLVVVGKDWTNADKNPAPVPVTTQ
jgi:LCP family protein required for cell wall assembly